MNITAFDLAQRFIGVHEGANHVSNPLVLGMLQLDVGDAVRSDDVPWCSAFANYVAWLLRLPRSKSLRARSWLEVGTPVAAQQALPGFDVVILKRAGASDGPEVIDAPGHVGFFAGLQGADILVLGGNQGDRVCVAPFKIDHVLGIRRLA